MPWMHFPHHTGFVILEEAAEAGDEAFLVSAVARGMVGDGREMGMARAAQATDESDESVEVTFLMAGGMGLIGLHETLLYGTIAAVRVVHRVCSS